MKPYEVKFEYLSEASTVIVAPDADSASDGAKIILAKNGLRGVNVLDTTEITEDQAQPTLN